MAATEATNKEISQNARDIIRVASLLHQKNCLAACDGNISVRLSDSRILITPTGRPKAFIQESEMALLDDQGRSLHGKASGEKSMHMAIFKMVPQARAVVHAHPPVATAWSIAKPDLKFLPETCLSELILAVGSVPIVPYQVPGTVDMGEALLPFLPDYRVMILGRHGALAWGETLEEAYLGIERLEHTAITLKAAIEIGGSLTHLKDADVARLKEMRRSGPQKIF